MSRNQACTPLSAAETKFFHNFYETYKGFIFYVANGYTTSPADCEDVVQDSVIRLMCNVKVLMELNHPKTVKYIALTVKSAFLDHQKKVLSAKEADLDEEKLAALLERTSIHTDAELEQTKLEVYQLKQTLSERDWLVLEGKYIMGYSQDELSELIGVSSDSIRMILHRAKKNARDILLAETANGGDKNGQTQK